MKIAIFHELNAGGARRAVNELAKRLGKNNKVDLYIVDEKNNKYDKKFFDNVFFYKFIQKKWSGGDWKIRLYKDTIELYRLRRLHQQIASDINKNNYDLAFIHPSKYTQSPFILLFLKIPKVYYCEEALRMVYEEQFELDEKVPLYKRAYEKAIRFVRKKIDKANISNADLVLANSEFTKKNIRRAYGIKSKVSYLGVDSDFFKPEKIKKNIDILYIGAKDQVDGYYLLSKALRLISKKMSVKYHFTDEKWMSDVDLKRLYNRSKIAVCLAKNEPFGLIPLEAMSCGISVIATLDGGYKESVIDEKTGYLIKRNASVLAEKIEFLFSEEKLRRRMGNNARKHVIYNWNWDRNSAQIEKIFNDYSLRHLNLLNSSSVSLNRNKIKIIALISIFIFSILLRLGTINQMGRTWDEAEYVEPGYKLVELMRKGDLNNSFFYTSYNHPPLVKYLYGITAHFDVEKYINNKPIFNYDLTYSRILSALMFSLGVVGLAIIGWRFFSPFVGVGSGIILSMLPFSLGLSQLVTAESLKIFIYPLAVFSFFLLVERYSLKRVITAGILTGIALQAKQSNALLFPMLGAIFLFQYRNLNAYEKKSFIKVRLLTLFSIIVIGIVIFVLIWPQAVFHFREVYSINQTLWSPHFSPKIWQITLSPPEVFFGRLMITPNFYYIIYFFITIPALIIILFFMGAFRIFKEKKLYLYIISLWFLIPFVMSIYSWRQHGLRYIIEIYPAIALISAVGFDSLTDKISKRLYYKFLLFIPVVIYLYISLWQIRPYYLDYFNEFVGGTRSVYKYNLFQIGWWGQGLREAGLYVINNAPKGSHVGLAISPGHVLLRSKYLNYSDWISSKKYDYVIVNHYHIIRDAFDDSLIKKEYKLVYSVKADGASLVYVFKRK